MTKRGELLSFCKSFCYRPFSTNDVREWASGNYMSSADVRVREFARTPKFNIRRIPLAESFLRGLIKKGNAPLAFYENV